jgi:hypothetical protein
MLSVPPMVSTTTLAGVLLECGSCRTCWKAGHPCLVPEAHSAMVRVRFFRRVAVRDWFAPTKVSERSVVTVIIRSLGSHTPRASRVVGGSAARSKAVLSA